MGSLTSRPSLPQVQQPVIFTAPAPVAAPAPLPSSAPPPPVSPPAAGNGDGGIAPVDGAAGEEAQRLAREDSLLRRSRGRLGTVLTGFSGLLSQTVGQTARKTLLGE